MKSIIIAFIIFLGIAATAVYYPIQTDATLTGEGTDESPLGVAQTYKEYVAIISQSGTSDPTASVLTALDVGTIVYARTGVGVYTATLSSAFTANKTFVQANISDVTDPFVVVAELTSTSVITLNTMEAAYTNIDLNGSLFLTIRVYP